MSMLGGGWYEVFAPLLETGKVVDWWAGWGTREELASGSVVLEMAQGCPNGTIQPTSAKRVGLDRRGDREVTRVQGWREPCGSMR